MSLALAVRPDGGRDMLGIWIEQTEGAKFWMKVFTDLKTRGCRDILIAVTDGLKGMSEALAAVVPATTLQTVHRPPDSPPSGLCHVEGAQAARVGPPADLHGGERRGGERRPRRVCARRLGREVSHRGRLLAPRLDARHPVLRLSAGRAAGHLHHERARERARATAEDHQDARPFPDRRGGHQADLAGVAEHHGQMGAWAGRLEKRP